MEQRIFKPRRVTRPDAGGTLWAPVDQHGHEHGMTPSYDGDAIGRECDRLNRKRAKGQRT